MKKIIVNSLPKSGTHVLVRLFELVDYQESDMHLSGSLVRYSRNPIHNLKVFWLRGQDFEVDLDDPGLKVSETKIDFLLRQMLSERQFCEAHLPYSKELFDFLRLRASLIYITRDPRAVLVSHLNHVEKVKNYPLRPVFENKSVDERISIILDGYEVGSYKLLSLNERVNRSFGWSEGALLHTAFEKLIGPEGGGDRSVQVEEVENIFSTLGVAGVDSEEVADRIFYRKSETFNKGHIDAWKDALSPRQVDYITEELAPSLEKMGYLS